MPITAKSIRRSTETALHITTISASPFFFGEGVFDLVSPAAVNTFRNHNLSLIIESTKV